jgi:hypothetical protein
MKKFYTTLAFAIIFNFLTIELMGQSVMKPVHAYWQANGQTVSLSTGYNQGIPKPDKLAFVMFFDKSIVSKYSASDLTFEFTWFHYYSTQKEYMDSYTIRYSQSNVSDNNKYVIRSERENILSGWWEVRVKAHYDGEEVQFKGLNKFQIHVN